MVGLTNSNGEYTISDIPVGIYTVSARKEGYETEQKQNIEIKQDEVTTVDFVLVKSENGNGNIEDGGVNDGQEMEGGSGCGCLIVKSKESFSPFKLGLTFIILLSLFIYHLKRRK